ncbi:hypothetical protein HYW60_02750 [Candidatus Kaiserbacteria bacterium]|nr:hypothetical protein [Candidatus Kaiserbacteria bacterium]
MRIIDPGHVYELDQLGGGVQTLLLADPYSENVHPGLRNVDLIGALVDRTRYLYDILPCRETANAEEWLRMALGESAPSAFQVLDPGHIYQFDVEGPWLWKQRLIFVKRSGGAIRYEKEWAGLQTQEVLRALIEHAEYLGHERSLSFEFDKAELLRKALFEYEARAYRRKQEGVNRKQPKHDDTARPKSWWDEPYEDVPFSHEGIELRFVGLDGHIVLEEG